jgi:hypothetical protein
LAKQQIAMRSRGEARWNIDTWPKRAPTMTMTTEDGHDDELSGNQLRADTSSNSNFPLASSLARYIIDDDVVNNSGSDFGFDAQLDQKGNDLFDEVDEKLSGKEQQGLPTLQRVERREINRLQASGGER